MIAVIGASEERNFSTKELSQRYQLLFDKNEKH
jgi:hypothetical protein